MYVSELDIRRFRMPELTENVIGQLNLFVYESVQTTQKISSNILSLVLLIL